MWEVVAAVLLSALTKRAACGVWSAAKEAVAKADVDLAVVAAPVGKGGGASLMGGGGGPRGRSSLRATKP